jgi:hypothetical protein
MAYEETTQTKTLQSLKTEEDPVPTTNGLAKRSEKGLLTPDNCVVALIEHQPQMLFGASHFDRESIINHIVALAKATRVFDVPVTRRSEVRPRELLVVTFRQAYRSARSAFSRRLARNSRATIRRATRRGEGPARGDSWPPASDHQPAAAVGRAASRLPGRTP